MAWRLAYGWTAGPNPFDNRPREVRPTHVTELGFHSLEAALKYPSRGTWWEITSPDGQVVVSSYKGFDGEVCPNPSLCARQILNVGHPGLFPDAETVGTDNGFDLASHDDGVTWESVLLGVKNPSAARNGHQKPRPPVSLSVLSIESCTDPPNCVTIHHTSGRVTIRCNKLEIRETAKGAYHLTILDPESGHARGVYGVVDFDTVTMANLLGVRLIGKDKGEGSNGHSRLPKTWKPGLFKRAQADGSPPIDTRGHIRGCLAIDRRVANVTNNYGDHPYTYQRLLWHLTHIPTGSLIVQRRHRCDVEEIADALREEVPELTDRRGDGGGSEMVIDAEIGRRAQQVVDQYKGTYR